MEKGNLFLEIVENYTHEDILLKPHAIDSNKELMENTETLKKINFKNQFIAQDNQRQFKRSKYSSLQKADEFTQFRQKSSIPYSQSELKLQLMIQPICEEKLEEDKIPTQLPQCFQNVMEFIKLQMSRTKASSVIMKKISDYKTDLAREELSKTERDYLFNFRQPKLIEEQFEAFYNRQPQQHDPIKEYFERRNNRQQDYERIGLLRKTLTSLSDDEMERLVEAVFSQTQDQKERKGEQKSDRIIEKLAFHELNRCYFNDLYLSKAYIFQNCLNRILQGDFNFIQLLQIENNDTPLTVHPVIFGTRLYFEEKLNDTKGTNTNKKIYNKTSSLPTIIFINIDGFDHPINLEIIKRFNTFHYFSVFQEFFNPDSKYSFYKYLKERSEILKSCFPFFTPFYKHVENYYKDKEEKAKQKKQRFSEDDIKQINDKMKKQLEGLYKGVISDEEFAFLFEEYIFMRIHEFSKVDAVILSYSCVLSPENSKTNHIFSLSEEVFFNIFTHLIRRTKFSFLFVPRLIINTYKPSPIASIPNDRLYPAQTAGERQLEKYSKALFERQDTLIQSSGTDDESKKEYLRVLEELRQYEETVRSIFGINQQYYYDVDPTGKKELCLKSDNQDLIKYVQHITSGFFQYLNTLNFYQGTPNVSVFSNKKDVLNWKFVSSTSFMQKILSQIKSDKHKNSISIGKVKKNYSYMIEVLKQKEKQQIQSYSDSNSIEYVKEYIKSIDLIDSIFLFTFKTRKSDFIDPELKTDTTNVKKFKLINSLNKSCYLTKHSQYFVDYKNSIVYFFNLLFPSVEQISNDQSDLVFTVANCFGAIPAGEQAESELTIYKMCDWRFSRTTLGKHDDMSDKRKYFLQNSTIIECNYKQSDKCKFLLFFGGEINYFDQTERVFNLNQKSCIKSTCLYVLKIQQKLAQMTYRFEEVKMLGIKNELISNLSYSSGASVTYIPSQNVNNAIASNTYTQKQKYMFIFGGQYESSTKEECSLQNVILFSNITDILETITNPKVETNIQTDLPKEAGSETKVSGSGTTQQPAVPVVSVINFNSSKFIENQNVIFSDKSSFLELMDQANHLELIDESKEIQSKETLQLIDIFSNKINQIEENQEDSLEEVTTKEQAFKVYLQAMCYKITNQKQKAYALFETKGLLRKLYQENPEKIALYIDKKLESGNEPFNDSSLEYTIKDVLGVNYLNEEGLTIKQELSFIQCMYLYQDYPNEVAPKLVSYIDIQNQRFNTNQSDSLSFSNKEDERKYGLAHLILSKCVLDNNKAYYENAYKILEKFRNPKSKNDQMNCYTVQIQQIPKACLTHLDSIKSVNMRKAFALQQKEKQQKNRLDTRILLVGGTSSRFTNLSDSNKNEFAHFFYPNLFLQSFTGPKQKAEIKPEQGFIQRIDLKSQFQSNQLASMNHNYILKCKFHMAPKLDVVNQQNGPHEVVVAQDKKDQILLYLVELRILESYMLNSKKQLYLKDQDCIADENIENIQFYQTFLGQSPPLTNNILTKEEELKANNIYPRVSVDPFEKNKNKTDKKNQSKEGGKNDSKQGEDTFETLKKIEPIYKNQEDQLDGMDLVKNAQKLNQQTINDQEQKKVEYIQKLQNNIYVDESQRFQGCYFTSISMRLESIFLDDKTAYQSTKLKPKPKASFWEIMKQYNRKNPQLPKYQEQANLKSILYESPDCQIIFNQQHIKLLTPNGNPQFSRWCLFAQPAHLTETDNYMHIFWRDGSTKLVIYDNFINKIIQVQMMIYQKKQNIVIVPEAREISQVFFNQRDQHVYICVEEGWQYNYQHTIMRAPLHLIDSTSTQIVFREEVNKHMINFNKITFTMNPKDKIFGILQERQLRHEELVSSSDFHHLSSDNQGFKWLLHRGISQIAGFNNIIQAFEPHNQQAINYLEINVKTNCIKDLFYIIFYLAILSRQVEISEIQKIWKDFNKNTVKAFPLILQNLTEKLKSLNQDENDRERPEFRSLAIITNTSDNLVNLCDEAIEFLSLPNVRSLISSSFTSLILSDKINNSAGILKLADDTQYKISYLDISNLILDQQNVKHINDAFITYFQKRGSFLKYLNIAGNRNLLSLLIYHSKLTGNANTIKFPQLQYIDISNTSLLHKNVLVEYIRFLLTSSYQLKGINLYNIKEESTNDPLFKFDDLLRFSFTSMYPYDYELLVYVEKELSCQLQRNTDPVIDQFLVPLFGENLKFIPDSKRQYQILQIKTKQTVENTNQSERIDKLTINHEVFKDPIVFASETKYLIFERLNVLKEEKKQFHLKFYSILQSEQKCDLDKVKNQENVTIIFKHQIFSLLQILNISKQQNDDTEKFTIFGIMLDHHKRAYLCRICLPYPQGENIHQDSIEFYKSKANIKKYSGDWMKDCFIPIPHNKKVKNTYLCVKDVYQQTGYSFFKADEKVDLNQ